jgi:hypothetical protein
MKMGRNLVLCTFYILMLTGYAHAQDASPSNAEAAWSNIQGGTKAYLDANPRFKAMVGDPRYQEMYRNYIASQSAPDQRSYMLIQKKYPGIAGAPPSHLFVDNEVVRLDPLVSASTTNELNARSLPYLIVSDQDYLFELKKRVGFSGKPANHVLVRSKETIILKSSEIDTKVFQYPGLVNQPSNHVMIDGVHSILVKKSEYLPLLRKSIGIADLPPNYIMVNNQVVQVILINNPSDLNPPMSPAAKIALTTLDAAKMESNSTGITSQVVNGSWVKTTESSPLSSDTDCTNHSVKAVGAL